VLSDLLEDLLIQDKEDLTIIEQMAITDSLLKNKMRMKKMIDWFYVILDNYDLFFYLELIKQLIS